MTPGTYALSIYRGDDHAWRFLLWQDIERTLPVDLTGFTVKAEIRDRPSGMLIVPLDIAVTLPNIIDMGLSSEDSRDCPASGRWDLQLTDIAGWVSTVLAGPSRVTADITESTLDTPLAERPRSTGYLTDPAT